MDFEVITKENDFEIKVLDSHNLNKLKQNTNKFEDDILFFFK